jgi:hypothetical protein
MKRALLLDVVIAQSAAVLELLSGKDQALLIRRNSFLILDLGLYIFNRIGRLDIERNSLARQGLDKDLHDQLQQQQQSNAPSDASDAPSRIAVSLCGVLVTRYGVNGVDWLDLHIMSGSFIFPIPFDFAIRFRFQIPWLRFRRSSFESESLLS